MEDATDDQLIEERLPEAFDGDRVDRVVAAIADVSRSAAKTLIDEGRVRVDAAVVRSASRRVDAGVVVTVAMPPPEDPSPKPDPSVAFTVVFEDDDVIVVDKPPGLVVHPGAGQPDATLVNGLADRYPEVLDVGERHRPGIVHRLDRGTSGLLVVARNDVAYVELVEQLSNHRPERVYLALAWGHLGTDHGTIDAPIGRSARHPTRMAVTEAGRTAVTHYAVEGRFDEPVQASLVRCRLETGRTHQIRVHLRAIGHPVVGDREYDGGRPGLDPGRPFLHATVLRFDHPRTGQPMEFEAPLPSDLADVLARCR
ncbi:MAG: RluA family pseudouridine synthase [Actinomycetota bacterium]